MKNIFIRVLLIGTIILNLVVASNMTVYKGSITLASIAKADWPWTENEPVTPGKTGILESCVIDRGGGWFSSSVMYVCYDQYVCPSCTCNPYGCGE